MTIVHPADETTPPPRQNKAFTRWIGWLIALSLLLLLAALNVVALTIHDLTQPLEQELSAILMTMESTAAPNPTADALASTLVFVRGQVAALEPVQTELAANHLDWPTTMQYIANFDPVVMNVSSINQNQRQITISGEAQSEGVVIAYADALRASGVFIRVTVQSLIVRMLPTSTPTEGAVGSPASLTFAVEFLVVVERS